MQNFYKNRNQPSAYLTQLGLNLTPNISPSPMQILTKQSDVISSEQDINRGRSQTRSQQASRSRCSK